MNPWKLTPIVGGMAAGIAVAIFFLKPESPVDQETAESSNAMTLSEEELAAEAWDGQFLSIAAAEDSAAVSVEQADAMSIQFVSENGYHNADGEYVIDLLELDYAYLAVRLLTPDGRSVKGALPSFALEGTSRLLPPDEVASRVQTDATGRVDFAIVGGKMGLDRLRVTVKDRQATLLINVISLRSLGLPQLAVLEGGIPWQELMQARLEYEGDSIAAQFSPSVAAKNGEIVKLTGFIMPLETDLKQHHFLLTSNPPSCFFHIPGGPAGAIEVFADTGIEMTWDPVVLAGRFEALESSDAGVVYRLHNTQLVEQ